MNPYLIIAALLAVAGAGYGGFTLGVDHEKANQIDQKEIVAAAVEAANATSAKAIAALKVKSTTITNEVQREIRTNTVYTDCKLTPGGLLLANQALDPSRSLALGSGKLPKADVAE
jgi:hypothetical protein